MVSLEEFKNLELNSYFLRQKNIDFKKINENLKQAFVLYGDNDPYVPQEVLRSLADELNIEPEVFANGGHLNTAAGYIKFPRLLEIVRSL
jgi:predicted alpha/beta hydrolase family esterase